jgi:hypothetical protein
VHTIRGPSPRRLLRDHNVGGLDHRQDVVTLLQAEISNVLILIDAVTVFPPPMSMAMWEVVAPVLTAVTSLWVDCVRWFSYHPLLMKTGLVFSRLGDASPQWSAALGHSRQKPESLALFVA